MELAARWPGSAPAVPVIRRGSGNLADHERGPEDALEDREDVRPEALRLLEEPHPGTEDAETEDGTAARTGRAGLAVA